MIRFEDSNGVIIFEASCKKAPRRNEQVIWEDNCYNVSDIKHEFKKEHMPGYISHKTTVVLIFQYRITKNT